MENVCKDVISPTEWQCQTKSLLISSFWLIAQTFSQFPQHGYSLNWSFYVSYITSFENLGGDQDISCLMIISSILITCVVAEMVIR